jgi:RNA polymerase sigma-70 factor (ECF subfamily)
VAGETPGDDDVRAARRGDVRAFERLFCAVQPPLLRYLRVLVGQDAPDVASETWLQVSRDLKGFTGDGGDFRGWVVRIGRNRALDHLRAAGRRPSDPRDPAELPVRATGDDTFTATDEALATRRALDLIGRLPQEQAEAVLLRVVVGLDAPAAAKVLGRRPGAVRMATSRGLARLQELVGDDPAVTLPGSTAL